MCMSPPPHQTHALMLLSRALEPKARVRKLEGSTSLVELTGPAKHTERLQLVPWGTSIPKPSSWGVVWIIRDGAPKLRQMLRARGESFVDLAGAVRVDMPHLVVDRTDLAPVRPPRLRKRPADPFADRSSSVVRVLLGDRIGRRRGVRELATESRVDPARVSRVVRALSDLGLVRFQRTGRAASVWLETPDPLLERWTNVYSWTSNVALAVHAPIGDPRRFVLRLGDVLGPRRWALTLHAGAAQVAPHAPWDRVHVYVDATKPEELGAIAADAEWPAAREGKLVLLTPFYRTSLWQGVGEVHGAPVVSNLQLVLDLWHHPERGREQAEHVLDTLIRPVWGVKS